MARACNAERSQYGSQKAGAEHCAGEDEKVVGQAEQELGANGVARPVRGTHTSRGEILPVVVRDKSAKIEVKWIFRTAKAVREGQQSDAGRYERKHRFERGGSCT
jgi:hypothetical protein